jgi:hypothetical protein
MRGNFISGPQSKESYLYKTSKVQQMLPKALQQDPGTGE